MSNILKKNVDAPGYSYEYLPTVKRLFGLPRVPSDKELGKIGEANPEDLVSWTKGIQHRIRAIAQQSKPPERRAEAIKHLAKKLESIQVEVVRRYLASHGILPGQTYFFDSVLASGSDEVMVPEGRRTLEEQAKLHGKEIARELIHHAFLGEGMDKVFKRFEIR